MSSSKAESQPLLPLVKRPTKQPKVGFFERRRRKRLLQKYYDDQRDLLTLYARDDQLLAGHIAPVQHEHGVDQVLAKLLFALNLVLIVANLAAAILSGSLSIVSTFVDTTMDLTTSVIINICLRLIQEESNFQYPRGRGRLEVLGVIVCSVIMGVANIAMIVQAVEAILNGNMDPDMNLPTLAILLGGCITKFFLMLICFKRGTSSSKVLALDMRNDIATTVVAIVCAFIGDRFWKFADPIGAILVCGMISLSWFGHALKNVPSMIGVRGDQQNISRILRIAIEHDDRITKIDHHCIFHIGTTSIVELHVVMNQDLPLKVTHDIAHPLEKKLNQLEFVERTYIHCDYFCDGD